MGRSILNVGLAVSHPRITTQANLEDAVCLSDYDAVVIDPTALSALPISNDAFARKQAELRDLVLRKGGLLLCILRVPKSVRLLSGGMFPALAILDLVHGTALNLTKTTLRMGTATKWSLAKRTNAVAYGYHQALAPYLMPEAFLEAEETDLSAQGGVVISTNSAKRPISFEFPIGAGRLCFVPATQNVPDGQLGSAIARMVEEHFGGSVEIEPPSWVSAVSVPGGDTNDARIAYLESQRDEIAKELSRLSEERSRLLSFRVLLFGYGKSLLEPVVRQGLREVGFKVLEPEEYAGEWDVDLVDELQQASAVGEVEGSEGPINVDKFRQLLEYVEAEENVGRKRKGILIGNGFRLKGLDEPERSQQFTEAAVKRARGFEYCLLPTSELFKAVCAVLKSPMDDALKKHLRESILSTIGVWKFTEPTQASADGAAAAST